MYGFPNVWVAGASDIWVDRVRVWMYGFPIWADMVRDMCVMSGYMGQCTSVWGKYMRSSVCVCVCVCVCTCLECVHVQNSLSKQTFALYKYFNKYLSR